MTGEETVVTVIDALTALRVPYVVSESLASNFYGVPRSTQDADLVLELSALPLEAFAARIGPGLRSTAADDCPEAMSSSSKKQPQSPLSSQSHHFSACSASSAVALFQNTNLAPKRTLRWPPFVPVIWPNVLTVAVLNPVPGFPHRTAFGTL